VFDVESSKRGEGLEGSYMNRLDFPPLVRLGCAEDTDVTSSAQPIMRGHEY